MGEQNKNISVDDILREYAAMDDEPAPVRPQTTVEADGDQVWRPAHQPEMSQETQKIEVRQNTAHGGKSEWYSRSKKKHKPAKTGKSRKGGSASRTVTPNREEQPRVYGHHVPEEYDPRDNAGRRPKKKKKRHGRAAALVILLLLVAGAGTALGYTYATDTVFRGVTAGTVEVGGLSVAEAQNKIQTEVGPVVETGSIQVKIYDTEYPIAIQDVTTGLDAAASAQAAYDIGHTGGVGERVAGAFGALFGGKTAELVITVDDAALDQRLDEIASEALTEPTGATWELSGTNLILTMPKPGVSFDRDKVRGEVKTKIETMDFTPYEVETQLTDPEPLDVDELKTQVDCEPTNAIVDKSDGKTIIPEKNGIEMDADKAREIIGDGTEATYTIPVTVTPAKVTKEVLDRALFRDVLSSVSTSLNTGNVDRTNNVTLAAKYMNGTILNPGEEFSYNGIVGQRTTERGFKAAGAYSNGQLIDEVGGGVCQPSSTLYMAVLRADLEVTERTNHSMTVAYTPLGEDATVSYGSLDFKFKNNTDYPIKLITVREGSQMKAKIMGTKVDDKTVRLETEILETLTPETIKKTDSSLKPGETEVQQSAVTGYKTITYKYVTVNGETTKEVANRSSYRKRDKIVLVGPEATSEPASSSSTTNSSSSSGSSSSSSSGSSSSSSGSSSSTSDPES